MEALLWLTPRGGSQYDGSQYDSSASGGSGNSSLFTNNTKGEMLLGAFEFQAAKSIRTSTIILAGFNIAAALGTAAAILYDCYASTRRSNPKYSIRRSGLAFVNSAEVYPLVLSLGIAVQGVIFAAAQSLGLGKLLSTGCTVVVEYLLPGLFLVALIQLVLGFETTFRGLRSRAFQTRGRYDIAVCLVVVGALLLGTFLVTHFVPSPDLCFASLFWFVARYAQGCFGFFLFVTVFLAKYAIIIYIRLRRSNKVEVTERVAASRLIYYMAFGVVSNGLLVPFFASLAFYNVENPGTAPFTLSMVSSVVANVNGLMTGGLHLFLRSSKFVVVHAKDKGGVDGDTKRKYQIRLQGPGDLEFEDQMVASPSSHVVRRMNSKATLISDEKEEEAMLESPVKTLAPSYSSHLPSFARFSPASLMQTAQPVQLGTGRYPTQTTQHVRKRSYSLFPSNAADAPRSSPTLPATTYSPNLAAKPRAMRSNTEGAATLLKPPAPTRGASDGRHRRNSSVTSSATVQMVLRLSSSESMPPIDAKMLNDMKVYNLDCPKVAAAAEAQGLSRPTPLTAPASNAPGVKTSRASPEPRPTTSSSATMKTLPPVPHDMQGRTRSGSTPWQQRGSPERGGAGETLGPNVYDPQSPDRAKLPSPRGVGFTNPAAAAAGRTRSNSTSASPGMRGPGSPPRRPTLDGSPRRSPAAAGARGKADWI